MILSRIYFFVLFVCFWFFRTWFPYVVLAVLELYLSTRLPLNSQIQLTLPPER